MRTFPDLHDSFRYEKQGLHIDKALVIKDADNNEPGELSKGMTSKLQVESFL